MLIFRFLLVVLHIELLNISNAPMKKAFLILLADLAVSDLGTLDNTYNAMWNYIMTQHASNVEIARDVFSWIVFSKVPLPVEQFTHALTSKYIHDNMYDPEYEYDTAVIMGSCLGLVVVNEQQLVQFMHPSAQEFFVKKLSSSATDAHTELCLRCLKYLGIAELGRCDDKRTVQGLMMRYPFLSYAAIQWAFHAEHASNHVLTTEIVKFLEDADRVTRTLRVAVLLRESPYTNFMAKLPHQLSGMHLAAYSGLLPRVWLPSFQLLDIDHEDSNGWTSLRWAVFGERRTSLDYLINNGSKTDQRDKNDGTTLMWALRSPQGFDLEWDKVLVSTDVVLHCGDRYSLQPGNVRPKCLVPTACSEELIDVLIARAHNIDVCNGHGRTALLQAAQNHQFAYMRKMISAGADINRTDEYNMTALLYALDIPLRSTRYG